MSKQRRNNLKKGFCYNNNQNCFLAFTVSPPLLTQPNVGSLHITVTLYGTACFTGNGHSYLHLKKKFSTYK